MSEIDFTKYSSVDQIESDIKDIKIQGATNVAIATFEGMKLFLTGVKSDMPVEVLREEAEKIGIILSEARPNEPLAKNGVKFIFNTLNSKHTTVTESSELRGVIETLADEYLAFIKSAKVKIIENARELLSGVDEVLTHCHSSTAEQIIIDASKRSDHFKAVCTETRPLFQGRITATNLLNGGVETTLIADSAVESYIIGRGAHDIDMVFIGCDEITMQGDAINKIGSWGVSLASYYASKPVYVVGSILKTDVTTAYKPVEIEMREAKELWEDAPNGLKMVNPAFELVDGRLINGFITELGILKPEQIEKEIQRTYSWLF